MTHKPVPARVGPMASMKEVTPAEQYKLLSYTFTVKTTNCLFYYDFIIFFVHQRKNAPGFSTNEVFNKYITIIQY